MSLLIFLFSRSTRILTLIQLTIRSKLQLSSYLTAPRYSLGALIECFGLSNLNPHRAQDDAEATMAVFQKLHQLAGELPLHLLAEIVRHLII